MSAASPEIPKNLSDFQLRAGKANVSLTNLTKVFWPAPNITKRDLLAYYASVAPILVPHLRNRAMVMKRYPNGVNGPFFFMKRTPENKPPWLETCAIMHASGSLIHFPMVQDLASLLWVVNLGCIDLNQWYATCDDVDRPDYLHFDLDPVAPATFKEVRETALQLKDYLDGLKLSSYPKTTGSRGIHIYIPIRRGPKQKEVWAVAKRIAIEMAQKHPRLITSEYRIKKRPAGRVLVDYNQNAWGRTLASVYSVRPTQDATVSAPVSWDEVSAGVEIQDFTLRNMHRRIRQLGDLFAPLLAKRGRCDLGKLL